MITAWPFFTYYGGKWRIAKKYPKPAYKTIIEPFAGSAGYSVKWQHPRVQLYDLNEKVIGVWQYLISVSELELKDLSEKFNHVDELDCCQEAKWLIGFWLNKGHIQPCYVPSKWMRSGIRPNSMWGPAIKQRLISQLHLIRDWKAEVKDYQTVENIEATWFIDPPYQKQGHLYTYSYIDFEYLAEWSKSRKGQTIVCEANGANWLPFKPFVTAKGLEGPNGKKKIKEVIWTS